MRLQPGRRRGAIAVVALVLLPLLILALVLAVFSAQAVEIRTRLHAGADAATLAATQTLLDDCVLRDDRQAFASILDEARHQARRLALENRALLREEDLQANEDNRADGDIVFGFLDQPGGQFEPADLKKPGHPLTINAVRVTLRRTRERGNAPTLLRGPFFGRQSSDLVVSATAMLDRQIVGLRPVNDAPLPLVPIALFSSPQNRDKRSWEYQVEGRNGGDQQAVDHTSRPARIGTGRDGLHEMTLTPGVEGNVCFLQLGVQDVRGLAQQIGAGVKPDDLAGLGGELLLDQHGRRPVPGSLIGPQSGTLGLEAVRQALERLRERGEPRVWPLYSGFDAETGLPVLSGFVAARVMAVGIDPKTGGLVWSLQPACLALPSAVTTFSLKGQGPKIPSNPYLAKIRLVQGATREKIAEQP